MRQIPTPKKPLVKWVARTLAALLAGGAALAAAGGDAQAQQTTFHLDRLEVPGAPDDGLVLFRPETQRLQTFYAQLGLGLSVDPLRTANITQDPSTLRASPTNAVNTQLLTYLSAGFELFDRLTLGFTFPVTWEQAGTVPAAPSISNPFNQSVTQTTFNLGTPAAGDTRIDGRYTFARADDRSWAFGGQLSVWAPTGGGSLTNFGGDNGFRWMPMVTGEWRPIQRFPWPIFIANSGVDFRPLASIGDPGNQTGNRSGLGIGPEWLLAVGALLPIAGDK